MVAGGIVRDPLRTSYAESIMTVGPSDVGTPCAEYQEMAESWDLIADLLKKTRGMRAAGTKWLPQEPKEPLDLYYNRLNRSFLYNGLGDTVRKITSKPFSRPLQMKGVDTLPEKLQMMVQDPLRARSSGRATLHSVMKGMFEDAVKWGLTHCLVDYPRRSGRLTVEGARKNRVHPYLVPISAPDLFYWKKVMDEDGVEVIDQIRWREWRTVPTSRYGDALVEHVRVMTRDAWELWQRAPEDSTGPRYIRVDAGTHSFGSVPVRTFYTKKTGFMTADPPLEDLGWVNLAHWQSGSDQRNILRFARVATLFMTGVADDDVKKPVVIGPSQVIKTSNADATMKYVEHTGASITAGERDLKALMEEMEILGMQPFVQRTGGITATGRAIDESKVQSDVQVWAIDAGFFAEELVQTGGQWIGRDIDTEKFVIGVHSDFSMATRTTEDIQAIALARKNRDITRARYLEEMNRRGLFGPSFDAEAEAAAAKKENEEEAPKVAPRKAGLDGKDVSRGSRGAALV